MRRTNFSQRKGHLAPLLLNPEVAGSLLGYTGRRMRQMAAEGTIPFVRLPGSRGLRFRPETLKRLTQECETEIKPAA